jgi:hypothetical protein
MTKKKVELISGNARQCLITIFDRIEEVIATKQWRNDAERQEVNYHLLNNFSQKVLLHSNDLVLINSILSSGSLSTLSDDFIQVWIAEKGILTVDKYIDDAIIAIGKEMYYEYTVNMPANQEPLAIWKLRTKVNREVTSDNRFRVKSKSKEYFNSYQISLEDNHEQVLLRVMETLESIGKFLKNKLNGKFGKKAYLYKTILEDSICIDLIIAENEERAMEISDGHSRNATGFSNYLNEKFYSGKLIEFNKPLKASDIVKRIYV